MTLNLQNLAEALDRSKRTVSRLIVELENAGLLRRGDVIDPHHKEEYEVTTSNIFADLGLESSGELIARAKLLQQVGALIIKIGLSQEAVAEKLGIRQPKMSLLVSGRLSAFSTDTVFHYLTTLGCKVEIRVKQPTSSHLFHGGGIAVC